MPQDSVFWFYKSLVSGVFLRVKSRSGTNGSASNYSKPGEGGPRGRVRQGGSWNGLRVLFYCESNGSVSPLHFLCFSLCGRTERTQNAVLFPLRSPSLSLLLSPFLSVSFILSSLFFVKAKFCSSCPPFLLFLRPTLSFHLLPLENILRSGGQLIQRRRFALVLRLHLKSEVAKCQWGFGSWFLVLGSLGTSDRHRTSRHKRVEICRG